MRSYSMINFHTHFLGSSDLPRVLHVSSVARHQTEDCPTGQLDRARRGEARALNKAFVLRITCSPHMGGQTEPCIASESNGRG